MSDLLRDTFLGKLALLFPRDTYRKVVRVMEITETGILFEVIKSDERSGYKVGSIQYIGNAKLNLQLIDEKEVNEINNMFRRL